MFLAIRGCQRERFFATDILASSKESLGVRLASFCALVSVADAGNILTRIDILGICLLYRLHCFDVYFEHVKISSVY